MLKAGLLALGLGVSAQWYSYPLSTLGSTLGATTWTVTTTVPVVPVVRVVPVVPLYTSTYSSALTPTYSLGSYLPSYSIGSYLPATTSSSVPLYSSTARATTPPVSSSGSVSVPLYGGTARSVSASVPLYGGTARTVSSTFGTYLPTYISLGPYGSTVPLYGTSGLSKEDSLFSPVGGFNSPWTPVPAPAVKGAAPVAPAAAETPEISL